MMRSQVSVTATSEVLLQNVTELTRRSAQTQKAFTPYTDSISVPAAPSNLTGNADSISTSAAPSNVTGSLSVKSEAQNADEGSEDNVADILSNLHCGDKLTGVGFQSVIKVLGKEGVPPPNLTGQEMLTLRSKKFFIAACLHQSELILPHWSLELIRLLLALRQSTASGWVPNLFVSIYESGSTDSTSTLLQSLEGHLNHLGVPHRIVLGGLERGHRNRIDFIADIRNRALEPLHNASFKYDYVLWLNDVFFCADGVAQMAFNALPTVENGLGADAVCGMDFVLYREKTYSHCDFYDIWVSHDMRGRNFRPNGQRAGGEQHNTLWHHSPFQVFSCWNGMVIFNADLFQERLVRFRRNHWQSDECAASETELLFRDMWKLGRGKVVVSPFAASAYDIEGFRTCAVQRQPSEFQHNAPIEYKPPPRHVSCCPLHEENTNVNFMECYDDAWHALHVGLGLTEKSWLVLSVFGLLPLGICISHFIGLQEERPLLTGIVIVGTSMFQVDYLNNLVSTIVFPLPMTMLGIQTAISSALLLLSADNDLCFELWSKARNVKRWSLLSPLFVLAFTAGSWLRRRDHTTMLLLGIGLLPLLALLFEPIIIPGSKVSVQLLLAAELIGLSNLFYTAMDSEGFDMHAWWYLMAYAALGFASHIFERVLLLDSSMDLSLRAMAFVKNITSFILLVILAIFQKEHLAAPEFFADLQAKPLAWISILMSAMAYLCYSYYLNLLLKHVCASSVFVLQTTMNVLPIYFQLLEYGPWVSGHPAWCLACLLGCVWFALERQAPYGAWMEQPWNFSKQLRQPEDPKS